MFAIAVVAVAAAMFATRGAESSRADLAGNAAIRVQASRTAHFRQPTQVTVYVRGGVADDGCLRVWLPADYLHKVEVQNVSPKPASIDATPDRLVYVFNLPDPNRPATVTFTFLPSEVGPLAGRIGLQSGEETAFKQFIDP